MVGMLSKRSAKAEALGVLNQAKAEAEDIKKHADLTAKADELAMREAFEKGTQEQRVELRQFERRLSKREDGIDRKTELVNKKEKYLETFERDLGARQKQLGEKE